MTHFRATLDHLKADPDLMGASRRAGGGTVLPNFMDTLQQPRVDNRDPRIRREQNATVDLRNSRRSKVGLDDEFLLDFASMTSSRTRHNRRTEPQPDLKRDLRTETNAMIQRYNRETHAEILRLALADQAGSDEQNAISNTCAQLLRLLEHPERTIWLVDRSISKRKTQAIPLVDEVASGLLQEREVAVQWLNRIQARYNETDRISRVLNDSRKALSRYLKERKKGMDLMPDSYAGAVTKYPVPIESDPACLKELSDVYLASQERRSADDRFINDCQKSINDFRERVQSALSTAVAKTREQERELVLAKGQTRLAANESKRALHVTTIRKEVNEGPAEGAAYLQVSERHDRPLVKCYNKANGHKAGTITLFEESTIPKDSFERSQVNQQDDILQLDFVARALSAKLHDRGINKQKDSEIARTKFKLRPGRRHGIHG